MVGDTTTLCRKGQRMECAKRTTVTLVWIAHFLEQKYLLLRTSVCKCVQASARSAMPTLHQPIAWADGKCRSEQLTAVCDCIHVTNVHTRIVGQLAICANSTGEPWLITRQYTCRKLTDEQRRSICNTSGHHSSTI